LAFFDVRVDEFAIGRVWALALFAKEIARREMVKSKVLDEPRALSSLSRPGSSEDKDYDCTLFGKWRQVVQGPAVCG
jgi:hypothetical protein